MGLPDKSFWVFADHDTEDRIRERSFVVPEPQSPHHSPPYSLSFLLLAFRTLCLYSDPRDTLADTPDRKHRDPKLAPQP
jgi:hypothetical protein